jgi:hypothetical protein
MSAAPFKAVEFDLAFLGTEFRAPSSSSVRASREQPPTLFASVGEPMSGSVSELKPEGAKQVGWFDVKANAIMTSNQHCIKGAKY